jgi:methylmalonyl-CoA mutase N-terminal domain/subunit
VEILRVGAELEAEQVRRVREVRAGRDQSRVDAALAALGTAAEGTDNLLPYMREALSHYATVGEVCNTLRRVFGVHHPGRGF